MSASFMYGTCFCTALPPVPGLNGPPHRPPAESGTPEVHKPVRHGNFLNIHGAIADPPISTRPWAWAPLEFLESCSRACRKPVTDTNPRIQGSIRMCNSTRAPSFSMPQAGVVKPENAEDFYKSGQLPSPACTCQVGARARRLLHLPWPAWPRIGQEAFPVSWSARAPQALGGPRGPAEQHCSEPKLASHHD